jgi:pimeloyl-ACP methyl ester carboxylesterase
MMFFIWVNNIFEILPTANMPATARMANPMMLALVALVMFVGIGLKHHGLGYLKEVMFPPGVPKALRTIADALFERDGTPKVTYRDRLGTLAMPVRLVWGEADRIVPVEAADGLPSNVVVERVPGIGHSPHIEAPAAVTRAVRAAMGL